MSFFDSAKNRAMWERRMVGLRREKEMRRATGFAPQESGVQRQAEENPFRRRINLAQLEAREAERSGVRRVLRPGRERRVAREKEPKKTMGKQGLSL